MTQEEFNGYESKSQMKRVEILKAEKHQMTHEELLAKIDEIESVGWWSPIRFKRKETNALRAVVELPIEDNSKPDSFNMNFANRSPNEIAAQCFQWGYATAMNKVIQAIEKELK